MAYGTNKKKAAPAPKKAPAVTKKPASAKKAPAPKKSMMQKYKELPTSEKILKAPAFAIGYPLVKTIEAAEYGAKKYKQMKGDYEMGKKMRESKTQQSKKK